MWSSTLHTNKEECMHQGPKSTIEAVCARVGGIHHAAVPCQLPCDEKQVSVIAAKQNETKYEGSSVELDDLLVVMQHAMLKTLLHKAYELLIQP